MAVKIHHIFKDGSTSDDITGMFVPYNEQTKNIYYTLGMVARNRALKELERRKKEQSEEGAEAN